MEVKYTWIQFQSHTGLIKIKTFNNKHSITRTCVQLISVMRQYNFKQMCPTHYVMFMDPWMFLYSFRGSYLVENSSALVNLSKQWLDGRNPCGNSLASDAFKSITPVLHCGLSYKVHPRVVRVIERCGSVPGVAFNNIITSIIIVPEGLGAGRIHETEF